MTCGLRKLHHPHRFPLPPQHVARAIAAARTVTVSDSEPDWRDEAGVARGDRAEEVGEISRAVEREDDDATRLRTMTAMCLGECEAATVDRSSAATSAASVGLCMLYSRTREPSAGAQLPGRAVAHGRERD